MYCLHKKNAVTGCCRFVGVVVTDTDFIELDFNACGTSAGNPGPSYLSGIDRCQKTTGVRLASFLSVCGLHGL